MSKIFVDQVDPKTGTSLTLGTSGDTVNIPSGVTLANAGTVTGLPASAISSGTIATARLGSGTASSSTFLRGDQTYATAGEDNSPYFRAVGSGSQSVATATMTTIVFNSEQLDSDNGYDTSTYKYTIPSGKGGLWFFQAAIYSAAVSDGVQTDLMIYKNSNTEVGFNRVKAGGSIAPAMITGLIANVAAGDALYARFQQYNGSNVTIYPNNDAAYFAGFRIKSI